MCKYRLEEIEKIHKRATEAYLRARETGRCADEGIVRDSLSELFNEEHTDWLIEQAKKLQKIEYEIDNSDLATGIENIVDIVKG
jgi:hypothetical protein